MATNKLLNSQDFYEVMQQYRNAPTTDQERVVKAFEDVKTWIEDNLLSSELVIKEMNKKAPKWLTPEIRLMVKQTWESHRDCDDGLRIKALKLVRSTAKEAGKELTIKQAMKLMKKYCNISV